MKNSLNRRKFVLAGLWAGIGCACGDLRAHGSVGYVTTKIVMPPSILVSMQNKNFTLADVLAGRITAVQFMFTSCSSICPVQGATFSELQHLLGDRNGNSMQLLSLSIDALGDDAPALKNWLLKFGAGQRWRAGALTASSVAPAYAVLDESADPAYRHSSKVYIFDATGRLVWRTGEFPRAKEIAKVMENIARGTALAGNIGQ
jgi:protein SCO1/2